MSTRTTRTLAALALAACVLTGAALGTALTTEEDEPGWNCLISGNQQCGTAPHILGYILPTN